MPYFYDTPWCKIYYHVESHTVVLEWHGFASEENFRAACDASLALLEAKQTSKMLANNKDAKVVSPANQKWLNEEWFPKAYRAGYRTSAVVVSTNIFNEMTVKNIVNQMDAGKFTVQFFQEETQAFAWLQTM